MTKPQPGQPTNRCSGSIWIDPLPGDCNVFYWAARCALD